ncbi:MAG: hypothetical protein ACE5ES_00290 [Candidatus Nanoarchaeia archaeon]
MEKEPNRREFITTTICGLSGIVLGIGCDKVEYKFPRRRFVEKLGRSVIPFEGIIKDLKASNHNSNPLYFSMEFEFPYNEINGLVILPLEGNTELVGELGASYHKGHGVYGYMEDVTHAPPSFGNMFYTPLREFRIEQYWRGMEVLINKTGHIEERVVLWPEDVLL